MCTSTVSKVSWHSGKRWNCGQYSAQCSEYERKAHLRLGVIRRKPDGSITPLYQAIVYPQPVILQIATERMVLKNIFNMAWMM